MPQMGPLYWFFLFFFFFLLLMFLCILLSYLNNFNYLSLNLTKSQKIMLKNFYSLEW